MSRSVTLLECFSEVVDPRDPPWVFHELTDILALAVLAVIAGADGRNEIAASFAGNSPHSFCTGAKNLNSWCNNRGRFLADVDRCTWPATTYDHRLVISKWDKRKQKSNPACKSQMPPELSRRR